jgi:hypothetical protein
MTVGDAIQENTEANQERIEAKMDTAKRAGQEVMEAIQELKTRRKRCRPQ